MRDSIRYLLSMRRVEMYFAAIAAGLAGTLLVTAGWNPPNRNAKPRTVFRAVPRADVTPSYCVKNNVYSFVGIAGASDIAPGDAASVTSGTNNIACQEYSAIVSGAGNGTLISYQDSGALIGAGRSNSAGSTSSAFTSDQGSLIGAGYENSSIFEGFAGGGIGNNSGAGVIGAGGTAQFAASGSTQNNVVNGDDSFVGAGDGNVQGNEGGNGTNNNGFIGAGENNVEPGPWSSIVGGYGNSVASNGYSNNDENYGQAKPEAGVLGGYGNSSLGEYSVVNGGSQDSASGPYAEVLGGSGNTASGSYGIVLGGNGNFARQAVTTAAGFNSLAHDAGSFLWSDDVAGSSVLTDTAKDQFLARSSGGVTLFSNEATGSGVQLTSGSGTWASVSDRNAKTDVDSLDGMSVLARVSALPIEFWSYSSESGVRHIGPMAQDFYATFHVGVDDRHITPIDEGGIAISALRALAADDRHRATLLTAQRREISVLRTEIRRFESTFHSSHA